MRKLIALLALLPSVALAQPSGGSKVQIVGSGRTVQVMDTGSNDSAAVAIVDGSGTQITSFGGGTQYTEDAASAADPVGNQLMCRRRDTLSGSEVSADGDNIALNATSKGELYVKHVDGMNITNLDIYAEGNTDASINGLAFLWEDASDTLRAISMAKPLPVQPGTSTTWAATQSGTWNITNVSGTVSLPTGASTLAEQQTQTTALQLIDDVVFAEDTASANLDKGIQCLAVRKATPANVSGTDGDYEPLQVSAGRLWTSATVDAALPAGTNAIGKLAANSGVDIGDVDVTSLPGVAGDVAHDAADSGNPMKMGGKAISTAFPTAVASADRTNLITDPFGRPLVAQIAPAMQVHTALTYTSQQTGTDVIDPGASKKIAVTSVILGSYGTTACRVILWFGDNADTTYSAGTDAVLVAASFVPSSTVKPGLVFSPPTPVFNDNADRELHITTDAACSLDVTVESYEF